MVAARYGALLAFNCVLLACGSSAKDDGHPAATVSAATTGAAAREVLMNGAFRTTAQLQTDFVGAPMSGAAYSVVVPTKQSGPPAVVGFIYGFKLEDGGASIDGPSDVTILDATTGQLRERRRYQGRSGLFPAPSIDKAASDHLAELQDRLAPAFFAGERRASDVDAQAANDYVALFPRAVGEPLVPYYRELAPDWFSWLGS